MTADQSMTNMSVSKVGIDSEFIRATTTSKEVEIFDNEQQLVPEKDTSQSIGQNSFAVRLNNITASEYEQTEQTDRINDNGDEGESVYLEREDNYEVM